MSVTINIVNWSSGALHTWSSPTARRPSQTHHCPGADELPRRQAATADAGSVATDQERVSIRFAPGSLRGVIDAASTEGAGAVAQDAEVDQPDREHVLASPAQRAEYHPHTSKRDAPTVARDRVALL